MNASTLPAGLRIGSWLTLLTGVFVFGVALYFFVNFFLGLANPSEPWRSGQFTPVTYTLDDIEACDTTVATDFVLAQHIELANVMNTGFAVVLITIFGLRRGQRWGWFALLAIFLWVGLNDAIALLRGNQPLVPLIPEVIGLTGLFIARRSIFGGGAS
jgi:hypothetical protein